VEVDHRARACEDAEMLKLLRRVVFLGLLAAGVYALWKKLAGPAGDVPAFLGPQGQPSPFPPSPVVSPAPAAGPEPSGSWVEPDDGACPVSHPVKGKVTSGIFHVPGGQNYERTRADRCYADSIAAEADGMRQAKR
jgi:hypothetical protein